jgi:hypothetical protein
MGNGVGSPFGPVLVASCVEVVDVTEVVVMVAVGTVNCAQYR